MNTPPGQTRFGKYELLSRLAKGGMAETFRAQLTGAAGVTKQVVIKKVLPNLAEDEAFVTAFINEARVSTRLSHGNIAQVFDFGQVDGDYFIAMELVDGRSLSQVLERAAAKGFARLPEPIACFLAIEVLKGLHYAHTRFGDDERPLNIVHRDVSPENILVSFEGHTKVVDFGVAKAVMSGRVETEPGTVKGKFHYLSPEQALARPLDARSDVYAVGIVLYRMLCGVLPFKGQNHVVMHRITRGEFLPAVEVNPELSGALGQVVARAMETDREKRFATALEMQDALASFLYRREPTFSNERVMEWMHWLFRPELEADGRRVNVSPRFEAQLKEWSPPERSTAAVPKVAGVTLDAVAQRTTAESAAATRPELGAAGFPWKTVGLGGAVGLAFLSLAVFLLREEAPPPGEPVPIRPRTVAGITPAPTRVAPPATPVELTPAQVNAERQLKIANANAAIEADDWATATEILKTCFVGESRCPDANRLLDQMSAERGMKVALEGAEQALNVGDLVQAKSMLDQAAAGKLLRRRFETAVLRYKSQTASQIAGKPAPPELRPERPLPPSDDPKLAQAIALFEEAKALSKDKQYPPARMKLERCIKVLPRFPDCHKLLGNVWAKMGESEKGAREYREFIKYAPSDHPDLDRVKQIVANFDHPASDYRR